MGRSARHFGTAVTLAGAVLLAGCQLPFGQPANQSPYPVGNDVTVEKERGVLSGLFSRSPEDLPHATPVPMREATLERGYGGVIVRVTGVAPTQGYFNATLLPQNGGRPDEAGVVTLRLVAVPPATPKAIGPERTRLLMAAAFIDELKLRGIRSVRVVSALDSAVMPVPPRPVQAPPPPDLAEM